MISGSTPPPDAHQGHPFMCESHPPHLASTRYRPGSGWASGGWLRKLLGYFTRNASIFAAGPVRLSTADAANVITISAAVVSVIAELRPMGVLRWSSLSGASKYMALTMRP